MRLRGWGITLLVIVVAGVAALFFWPRPARGPAALPRKALPARKPGATMPGGGGSGFAPFQRVRLPALSIGVRDAVSGALLGKGEEVFLAESREPAGWRLRVIGVTANGLKPIWKGPRESSATRLVAMGAGPHSAGPALLWTLTEAARASSNTLVVWRHSGKGYVPSFHRTGPIDQAALAGSTTAPLLLVAEGNPSGGPPTLTFWSGGPSGFSRNGGGSLPVGFRRFWVFPAAAGGEQVLAESVTGGTYAYTLYGVKNGLLTTLWRSPAGFGWNMVAPLPHSESMLAEKTGGGGQAMFAVTSSGLVSRWEVATSAAVEPMPVLMPWGTSGATALLEREETGTSATYTLRNPATGQILASGSWPAQAGPGTGMVSGGEQKVLAYSRQGMTLVQVGPSVTQLLVRRNLSTLPVAFTGRLTSGGHRVAVTTGGSMFRLSGRRLVSAGRLPSAPGHRGFGGAVAVAPGQIALPTGPSTVTRFTYGPAGFSAAGQYTLPSGEVVAQIGPVGGKGAARLFVASQPAAATTGSSGTLHFTLLDASLNPVGTPRSTTASAHWTAAASYEPAGRLYEFWQVTVPGSPPGTAGFRRMWTAANGSWSSRGLAAGQNDLGVTALQPVRLPQGGTGFLGLPAGPGPQNRLMLLHPGQGSLEPLPLPANLGPLLGFASLGRNLLVATGKGVYVTHLSK